MDKRFLKAEWIWACENAQADEYAEFVFGLDYDENGGDVFFNVASDSDYNLFINGELAAFGQYGGYPDYTVYDRLNITRFLRKTNEIRLLVWYYGVDTQTYIKNAAGAIFEVEQGGQVRVYSGKHIQSRLCNLYENHYCKQLTSQIGYSYKYYGNRTAGGAFSDSVLVDRNKKLFVRPNEKLVLGERSPMQITEFLDGYLIDMQEERVGFLELDIESDVEQEIKITYGEYLFNGQVRYLINNIMDYSVEYVAKTGGNVYENRFRRLAGRYLQIYCKHPIKINYIGLRAVDYPVQVKTPQFRSEMRNKIYQTSVKTLRACMHEHFEDCPWREQALYAMDSRNEMLCAYTAFDDYAFARSNLVLMSKGLRSDGLLSICYPSGIDIPIPFFSLVYPMQVWEYVQKSGDTSILDEVFETAKTIVNTFVKKIEDNGLIDQFPYPYWNFYEWSWGSVDVEHRDRKDPNEKLNRFDLTLNCMFLYALQFYKKLCALKGETFNFDERKTREGIKKVFFDEKKGLYKGRDCVGEPIFYSVLGNSLAILCGLGDEALAERIFADKEIVPITLSMNTFFYEALLGLDAQKYKRFILDDIDRKYTNMLLKGATTFWETEEGAAALGDTGSLCHGWGAMPIYYYTLLNGKEYFNGEL